MLYASGCGESLNESFFESIMVMPELWFAFAIFVIKKLLSRIILKIFCLVDVAYVDNGNKRT